MSLRQILSALLLAAAGSAAVASPVLTNANAALKTGVNGGQTAGFSMKHDAAGLFTDTFTFLSSADFASINGSLTTIGASMSSDIDFISATLNGIDFSFFKSNDGGVIESTEVASDRFIRDADNALEAGRLLDKLRGLKEEYREAIVMKFLDGLETKEIATALGKTPANVRVLLHRATKALASAATNHELQETSENIREHRE